MSIVLDIQNTITKQLEFGSETLNCRTVTSLGSSNEFDVVEISSKSVKAVSAAVHEIVNSGDANIGKLTFVHVGLYDEDKATVNKNDKRLSFTLGAVTWQAANLTIQNIASFTETLSVTIPTISTTVTDERDFTLVIILGYKA